MHRSDLDAIKGIPNYKVILRAVLKSQIQQLVEQLADHTGEESVILTASVADGSLSHLGSESGKVFLEGHEDLKSQFLGFCLKRQYQQKESELDKINDIIGDGGKASSTAGRSLRSTADVRHEVVSRTQYKSPQPSGIRSVSLIRVFPKKSSSEVRHEPYSKTPPPRDERGSRSLLDPNTISRLKAAKSKTDSNEGIEFDEQSDSKSGDSNSNIQSSTASNDPFSDIMLSDRFNLHSDLAMLTEDSSSGKGSKNKNRSVKQKEASYVRAIDAATAESEMEEEMAGEAEEESEEEEEGEAGEEHGGEAGEELGGEADEELGGEADEELGGEAGEAFGEMAESGKNFMQDDQSTGDYDYPGTSEFEEGSQTNQEEDSCDTDMDGYPVSSDGKSYLCTECGQTFAYRSGLRTHRLIHAGVRPYTCSECGKSFTQGNNLYRHIRNKHQSKK